MDLSSLSRSELDALIAEHGSGRRTAAFLGVNESSLRTRLLRARIEEIEQSESGFNGTWPVLPGFAIKSTSTQMNADGDIEREWVQTTKAPGDQFEVPEGHDIKGVSALLDQNGRTIQQWVKTKESPVNPHEIFKSLEQLFSEFQPAAPARPLSPHDFEEQLTPYPWSDPHFGLYAWGAEAAANWDLSTSVRVIRDTFEKVVARSVKTRKAILLVGGDTLHSNTNENRTAKSGNVLQVDGRYPKVFLTACETIVANTDLLLDHHAEVDLIVIPGNHDEEAAYAVAFFLHAWYRNEPRVSVDLSPSLFRFREFGKVMIGTTHGHTVKIKDMPAIMAARQAEMWGRTIHRYVHGFHVHHSSKALSEGGGCITETHQIIAPQDAWHFGAGFLSGRSMQSICYDPEHGEVARVRVSVC